MSTQAQAAKAILDFLTSEDRVLLLNGTHQNAKHPLALSAALNHVAAPATVLFRTNGSSNTGLFLADVGLTAPKAGRALNVSGRSLFVDTINRSSWQKSPRNIDVAIVYPVDSLKADSGGECVQDLILRQAKKIFLVTWTDTKDYTWTNQFNPVRVTYDAESEDPEYHERMREIEAGVKVETPKNLPQYAQNTAPNLLVRFHCDTCRSGVWGRLNKAYPGITAIRNAKHGDYVATCLKCGHESHDNYNWYER